MGKVFLQIKTTIMTKHITSIIALLLVAQILWSQALQPSTTLTTYYANIDGQSSANDQLRITLCTIISTGYVSIGYGSLQNSMYAASTDPTDFVYGPDKTMEDIYSSKPYKNSDSGSSANDCGRGWNKEHTVPQSWFDEATPMKSDAHHVYPTDIRMNSLRSSYPYGENNAAKGCSSWGYGSVGTSTFPGYTGTVFDPGEGGEYGSYKGDLARTYFYMVTRYRTTNFTKGSGNTSFTYSGGVADLTDYMKNLMLKWHREDPVSPKELLRNNAIYAHQHNRNPFIDYPELVEYMWGVKQGQAVNLAALVSGYDGGGTLPPVPPTPAAMYGVTWSVNGEEYYTDSLPEESSITTLPTQFVSCSGESNVFMGWTDAPIEGSSDEAPAVLYKAAAEFPAVTDDVTYYAVFAKQTTSGSSAPATYTYDADHTAGWTNSAKPTGSYWLLNNSGELISPVIDLAGLTSIKMVMRTYGGSSFNTVQITANDQAIGTLVAAGNSLAEQTWTNSASLTGNAAIHFTANYTINGVGFSSVTINAAGSTTTYSRYITSCSTTTEVEMLPAEMSARKILVGGRIYILVGEAMYNIQGERIR